MPIPRIIHRAWLGGEEPAWTRGFRRTWEAHHPGWRIEDWDDERVSTFPLTNKYAFEHAEDIAPMNVGQLRADILRYEVLHLHGGVWVDADMECLKPIDPLLDAAPGVFFGWEETDRWVGNSIIGSVVFHPFLWSLIRDIPGSITEHLGKRPNVLTGPQYLTAKWKRDSSDVLIYPEHYFYPYLYNELDRWAEPFPDSYAVHHWNNARNRQRKPIHV